MRGVIPSEPEFVAIFPRLNGGRFSAGAKIPGGVFKLECEVLFGQNRNSWQYLLMCVRGGIRLEPKFLSIEKGGPVFVDGGDGGGHGGYGGGGGHGLEEWCEPSSENVIPHRFLAF